MTENPQPTYEVAADEKVTNVMVYTQPYLFLGDVITKEIIRVSTWLRTNTAPDTVHLHNVKAVMSISSGQEGVKSIRLPEVHIPSTEILALHIVPPAKDPVDYDPNEPNRRMDPVTAISGFYRFDGTMRMSTMSNLAKYIDITRENFSPMYDVKVTYLGIPNFKAIQIPYVIVRQAKTYFSPAGT